MNLLLKKHRVFLFWLFLVVIWNFGFPHVPPLADVIVAVILSFFSKWLSRFLKD